MQNLVNSASAQKNIANPGTFYTKQNPHISVWGVGGLGVAGFGDRLKARLLPNRHHRPPRQSRPGNLAQPLPELWRKSHGIRHGYRDPRPCRPFAEQTCRRRALSARA